MNISLQKEIKKIALESNEYLKAYIFARLLLKNHLKIKFHQAMLRIMSSFLC